MPCRLYACRIFFLFFLVLIDALSHDFIFDGKLTALRCFILDIFCRSIDIIFVFLHD